MGRCLVTNAVEDNGFEELFRDREHLVVYRSPQDLWELLDYYVAHDDEREAIARRGRQLAHTQHTYVHRVRTMLQVLCERLDLPQAKEVACAS